MTDRGAQWAVAEQWLAPAIQVVGITSADKYYAWLRTSNQPVTREVARAVWGETLKASRYADAIETWNPDYRIPRSWYTSTESTYVDNYAYKTLVTYKDPTTREMVTEDRYVLSDSILTRHQAEQRAKEQLITCRPDLKDTEVTFETYGYYHQVGAAW